MSDHETFDLGDVALCIALEGVARESGLETTGSQGP